VIRKIKFFFFKNTLPLLSRKAVKPRADNRESAVRVFKTPKCFDHARLYSGLQNIEGNITIHTYMIIIIIIIIIRIILLLLEEEGNIYPSHKCLTQGWNYS
jgi:hypothetical protein